MYQAKSAGETQADPYKGAIARWYEVSILPEAA